MNVPICTTCMEFPNSCFTCLTVRRRSTESGRTMPWIDNNSLGTNMQSSPSSAERMTRIDDFNIVGIMLGVEALL